MDNAQVGGGCGERVSEVCACLDGRMAQCRRMQIPPCFGAGYVALGADAHSAT